MLKKKTERTGIIKYYDMRLPFGGSSGSSFSGPLSLRDLCLEPFTVRVAVIARISSNEL